MPIKRGRQGEKSYYQFGDSGKKYFYIAGNKRSRLIAKHKAEKQQKAMFANQAGGASSFYNTQTPENMAKIQEKYKGQAHPDFINEYANILAQPIRMIGWRGKVPSTEWRPEEKAAYLRDGSPISSGEVIKLAGKQWNNMAELRQIRGGDYREYMSGMKPVIKWPLKPRPKRGQYGKNAVQ